MLPLKEVTEAILALSRNGYSSYLRTHRTGSSSPPTHTRLDSAIHQLYYGFKIAAELVLTVHTARWCREKPNK